MRQTVATFAAGVVYGVLGKFILDMTFGVYGNQLKILGILVVAALAVLSLLLVRSIKLSLVIGLLAFAVAILVSVKKPLQAKLEIRQPNNQRVGVLETVTVRGKHIPEGHSVWAIVRCNDGRLWPVGSCYDHGASALRLSGANTWQGKVEIGDASSQDVGESFWLEVATADKNANQALKSTYAQWCKTARYEGIYYLPAGVRTFDKRQVIRSK